jgi:hypothetical protein
VKEIEREGWRGSAWGGGRDKLSREIQNGRQKRKGRKKSTTKKLLKFTRSTHIQPAANKQARARTLRTRTITMVHDEIK